MTAANRPAVAWIWPADGATLASLADRLRAAGAADSSRVVARLADISVDAQLVVLATDSRHAVNAAARAEAAAPTATVVVALDRPTTTEVVNLVRSGIHAVVELDADDAALAHGVQAAWEDGSYVPARFQAAVIESLARHRRRGPELHARIASLNPTEREILGLLVAGADRAAIAVHLDEPVSRVRARIDRAKAKLGVSSQRQAVAMLTDDLGQTG